MENVYAGKNALRDFIDIEKHPYTPLVELPESLNPFAGKNVRIFAKLMNMNPLENVKAIPAYRMLKSAYEKGDLDDVHTIVESSSGNTVSSLAVIGRLFGIEHTKAIVSEEVPVGKLRLLQLFGTEIEVASDPSGSIEGADIAYKEERIRMAKDAGSIPGHFNPNQYDNTENPRAHEAITGRQIWEQTEGKITVLCAGLGTTGTIVGTSRFIRQRNSKLATVGVVRAPNNPVPGVRTGSLLEVAGFNWKDHTDYIEEVGTVASFRKSLELVRNGLFVGPSSGFALAGLLEFLDRMEKDGNLDNLRNENGDVICVFVCCDSPMPYISEYFEYLDESNFPKIKKEQKEYAASRI